MTVVLDTADKLEAASEIYEALSSLHGPDHATMLLTKCIGRHNTLRARFAFEKRIGILKAQPEVVTEVEI